MPCTRCRGTGHNKLTCGNAPAKPGYYWRGKWRSLTPRPRSKYEGLDEYIINAIGRLPIGSMALRERVEEEYGPIDERAFYRHLAKLRKSGAIIVAERRPGWGYDQLMYGRPNRVSAPSGKVNAR